MNGVQKRDAKKKGVNKLKLQYENTVKMSVNGLNMEMM
jgi:hypothetical protein